MAGYRSNIGSIGSLSSSDGEYEKKIIMRKNLSFHDSINNNNNNEMTIFSYDRLDPESYALHKMFTQKLEEQVSNLIRDTSEISTIIGLYECLNEVVHEILQLSEDEPYGIRGANIFVKIRNYKGDEDRSIGVISFDNSTVTTFNLILILHEEKHLPTSIRNWLGNIVGAKQGLVISNHFMLLKHQLYRSSSGVTITSI